MSENAGSLADIRVLDLSRVLAGPACTQLLGDLGADVIKIERPGAGDETRTWGPPFVKNAEGHDTAESAYYLSTNRNKRSVTLDISQPQGTALAKRLLAHCDVLIENFKVGSLRKHGIRFDDYFAAEVSQLLGSVTVERAAWERGVPVEDLAGGPRG